MAFGSTWNSTQRALAQQIYSRAAAKGVDPNLALGIAGYEGLVKSYPLSWNKDAGGQSFGPFQLYTGPQGGLADSFRETFGQSPSVANWNQQLDYSLDKIKTSGVGAWNAVKDQGGVASITAKGAALAQTLGLSKTGDAGGGGGYAGNNNTSAFGLSGPNYPGQPVDANNPGALRPGVPNEKTSVPMMAGGQSVLSGFWQAMGVTAVSSAGKTVGESNTESAKTVKEGLEKSSQTLDKSLTTNTTKAVEAGTSWVQGVFDNAKDLFVRFGVGLFALVLIGGAVWHFTRQKA